MPTWAGLDDSQSSLEDLFDLDQWRIPCNADINSSFQRLFSSTSRLTSEERQLRLVEVLNEALAIAESSLKILKKDNEKEEENKKQ